METHLKRKNLIERWNDEEGQRERSEVINSLRKSGAIPLILFASTEKKRDALAGADLRGINLSGEKLDGADLTGARLQGANLARCSLRNAKLVRADLRNTLLRNTDLTNADLRGASLAGAIMEDTVIDGADLTDAVISEDTIVAGKTRLPKVRGSKPSRWSSDSLIR